MFNHILMVCVGNICRSPMAEALLRAQAKNLLDQPLWVQSAGTHALVGHPADPLAESLMTAIELDISDHRGQKISPQLLQWADIILVMELDQKRHIEAQYPTTRGKVFRLLENQQRDIPDPYRQGEAEFTAALGLIRLGVDEWLEKLT